MTINSLAAELTQEVQSLTSVLLEKELQLTSMSKRTINTLNDQLDNAEDTVAKLHEARDQQVM